MIRNFRICLGWMSGASDDGGTVGGASEGVMVKTNV